MWSRSPSGRVFLGACWVFRVHYDVSRLGIGKDKAVVLNNANVGRCTFIVECSIGRKMVGGKIQATESMELSQEVPIREKSLGNSLGL